MKSPGNMKELIYIHLHPINQYVISYGIEFQEFMRSLPETPSHLLLLKHKFEGSDFNMHTRFDYIESEEFPRLLKEDVGEYGDFCWVDFEDSDGLNEMEGQEIAELLYLAHSKEHLRRPFYSKLNNRYAYLSHDDEWFNKTYYRHIPDFYGVLGKLISLKLGLFRSERSFFALKKGSAFPLIPPEMMARLSGSMKEGIVISLSKTEQSRFKVEVPMWIVGDHISMDDVFDDYMESFRTPPDARLVFDKKTHEWSIFS
ncbi:hypothetical protein NLX67_16785 [Domibacillus sp. A3M-37]|uniref:hypothetical protein n=1 Tax=Domibacillus sp. A3M-37 TaxID=2962037 RepID=UPI0020B7F0C9|nr:hypothetical protein [Domibacillus sp. A3M-37]MCP3764023.1 hypothetical protein [Domibacillus sp. A3M-37]